MPHAGITRGVNAESRLPSFFFSWSGLLRRKDLLLYHIVTEWAAWLSYPVDDVAKWVAPYQKVLGLQRNQVLINMSWLPMDDADREMNVRLGDPKFLNDRRELDLTVKTTVFSILTMVKVI